MGHYVLNYILDEDNSVESYAREEHNQNEYNANEFAGAFLMPEIIFKDVANDFYNESEGTYDVAKIAEEFGVSIKAATIRGKFLGVFAW